MSLSLIILKGSETILVAQTEQLEYEPKVHLINPHVVSGTTNVVLKPWPSYTDDTHILFNSESLLTVCDPSEKVRAAYMKKCNLKEEDLLPKESEPVMLTEENATTLQQGTYDEGDDYEPSYIEY